MSSKGFEGMEGTVNGDTPGDLRFNDFDPRAGPYTGKRWIYRPEPPAGTATTPGTRIHLADTRDRNGDGARDKTLVADLLDIANPKDLGGFGTTFRFPFTAIEDVVPLSSGRTAGKADDNAFITIRLSHRLDADKRAFI